MKFFKRNKGITLVALVVTIVIMLILAGVTLNIALGKNGLLKMSIQSVDKYKEASEEEQRQIAMLFASMNQENYYYYDKNSDKAIIPAGFAPTGIEGEDVIEDGLVITDSEGNEFVWVPVETIGKMVYCYEHPKSTVTYNKEKDKLECEQCKNDNNPITNFAGKLYASNPTTGSIFDEEQTQTGYDNVSVSYTGIREPDTLIDCDGKEENLKIVLENYEEGNDINTFKSQLQVEFNNMAESVGKYKGFYIGRYETSNLSDTGTTYAEISRGKVLKGQTSIKGANWFRQYVSNKKIVDKNNNKATSSMIWGCQWDQVILWMKDIDNTEKADVKYIKDSTGMGFYLTDSDSPQSPTITGSSSKYKVKNIYDMAGNVHDNTMEVREETCHICRGGSWDVYGYDRPASFRSSFDVKYDDLSRGSRSTLYIE